VTGGEQLATPPAAAAAAGPLGPSFEITIIAQDRDATVMGADGQTKILTSTVKGSRDVVKPGPRTHRFFVVDYDLSADKGQLPAEVASAEGEFVDAFARDIVPGDPALDDHRFHAQNVYAIAARTLSLFEHYLGRRVNWAFDAHQLHLVPNAQVEGNANYDKDLQAVLFGYVHVETGSCALPYATGKMRPSRAELSIHGYRQLDPQVALDPDPVAAGRHHVGSHQPTLFLFEGIEQGDTGYRGPLVHRAQ
jgi:hypothetical protein